jgi:hypothetical protein
LLVLFDSLVGKAFLARSIKLCLVDNQRSSGVTVAGFESCLIWNRIVNVEISTNRIYRLPLERSGLYSSPCVVSMSCYHWELPPLSPKRQRCLCPWAWVCGHKGGTHHAVMSGSFDRLATTIWSIVVFSFFAARDWHLCCSVYGSLRRLIQTKY